MILSSGHFSNSLQEQFHLGSLIFHGINMNVLKYIKLFLAISIIPFFNNKPRMDANGRE